MSKKTTKRALFSSVMALILCFSMLVGTTFAWFTDEVKSANNIITAGNLDVELEYKNVVNGQLAANWTTVQGASNVFNPNALWEPGHVEVVYLKVSNLGTLALKYQLGVNFTDHPGTNVKNEELKLSDHLVFKVLELNDAPTAAYTREEAIAAAGATKGLTDYNGVTTEMSAGDFDYVALIVYMPETVGNEANYKTGTTAPSIDLGIRLFATQVAAESDSFGTDYDSAADFPILSDLVVVPTTGNVVLTTESGVKVTVPADKLPAGVTSVQMAHSEPKVDTVNNTVSFDAAELVDQNGNVIDLNASNMSITLPAPGIANGTVVGVYHDGELVDTATVDNETITYTAPHFCQIVAEPVTVVANAADLKAAMGNGGKIVLNADINMGSEILVIGKPTTLEGEGFTLTSTAGRAINVSGADGVTIKNLTIVASGERAINIIQNATNVTIENVTATAANYTVNVAGSAPNAVVAIKDSTLNGLCTVNVSAAGAKVTVDNSTVNCNDNNTTAGEGYAALSLNKEAIGGSIVATNTTVNVADGSDSFKGRNGAENGTVTINGSTEGIFVAVAVITYKGSPYYYSFASLAKALEFAKDGDTITLIRDVTLAADEVINVTNNAVLNLNGCTLSGKSTTSTTSYLIEVAAGAQLTLTGTGTVSFYATTPDTNWGGEGQPAFPGYANNTIKNLGKLVVDGVTVKNITAPGGASYAIDCYQGSELIINSGVIDGCGKTAIRMFCNSNTMPTTVTINGGTITGSRALWLQLPGGNIANVRPVSLTINGGKLVSTDVDGYYMAIYSYSYGDSFAGTNVTITDGEFYGNVAFGGGNAKSTQETVTVTGGTFDAALGRYVEDNDTNNGWEEIAKP